MQDPLVSVHMITYNHAPYIAQAIDCVLAQKTNFPFELVIGEDCSTDGTREIVFDYAKKYPEIIRVIASDQNVGMKKNCYRTMHACQGKYIAYCEGDDYWHRDDKLQLQVDYLETHPECGLICSNHDLLDEIEGTFNKNHQSSIGLITRNTPTIVDILTSKGGIITCSVLARLNLIVKVVESDFFLHQDVYFKAGDIQLWCELTLLTEIHRFEESLVTYRRRNGSASHSIDSKQHLLFLIADTEMRLYLCKKHNLPCNLTKFYNKELRSVMLKLAFIENDFNKATIAKFRCPEIPMSIKSWVWFYGCKFNFIRILVELICTWRSNGRRFNKK